MVTSRPQSQIMAAPKNFRSVLEQESEDSSSDAGYDPFIYRNWSKKAKKEFLEPIW